MSINLGSAILYFTADSKAAKKELKQLKKDVAEAFSEMADVGKAALTGIMAAGAGLVAFGVKSIQASNESEAALAQLKNTIEGTGGEARITTKEIQDLAESIQEKTTYDDDQIIAMESILLLYKDIGREQIPELSRAVVDLATKMKGGTASTEELKSMAELLGKALSDPSEAAAKLKRAGIIISESAQEQIKAIDEEVKSLGAMKKGAEDAAKELPKLNQELQLHILKMRESAQTGKQSESSLMSQRNRYDELRAKIAEAKGKVDDYSKAQTDAANNGMTQADRERQKVDILLGELARYSGAAEAHAQTTTGRFERVRVEIGSVMEDIGEQLKQTLGEIYMQYLDPIARQIRAWIADGGLDRVMQEWARVIKDEVIPFVEGLVLGVITLARWLGVSGEGAKKSKEEIIGWVAAWLPLAGVLSAITLFVLPAALSHPMLALVAVDVWAIHAAWQALKLLWSDDGSAWLYGKLQGVIDALTGTKQILDAIYTIVYNLGEAMWRWVQAIDRLLVLDFSGLTTALERIWFLWKGIYEAIMGTQNAIPKVGRASDYIPQPTTYDPNPMGVPSGGASTQNISINHSFGNVTVRNQGDIGRLSRAISQRTVEGMRRRGIR